MLNTTYSMHFICHADVIAMRARLLFWINTYTFDHVCMWFFASSSLLHLFLCFVFYFFFLTHTHLYVHTCQVFSSKSLILFIGLNFTLHTYQFALFVCVSVCLFTWYSVRMCQFSKISFRSRLTCPSRNILLNFNKTNGHTNFDTRTSWHRKLSWVNKTLRHHKQVMCVCMNIYHTRIYLKFRHLFSFYCCLSVIP